MEIEWDLSISVISLIAFVIFSGSFLFNVGVLTQISASAFLEEFDDKEKLIKDARKKLFDFKTDVLRKMICLIPYFLSIIFSYSISPFVKKFMEKHFSDLLPTEYKVGYLIILLLIIVFYIGEAVWGINEKYIKRSNHRIYYNRPWYSILFLYALLIGVPKLDALIGVNKIQSIMTFLHINNIETFRLMYIFTLVVFLNNLFVTKWVSRYIVLIDYEIHINLLKEKNKYFSFYGMANLILSILMMFISILLAVKYSIWEDFNYFAIVWVLFMMMQISVLAGQRDYAVSITRRKYFKNNKVYFQDVNGKKRLLDKVK